ncbi:hypothetical protein RHSIM_Rhsim09G0048500 [Rhododendron simsii]|uniref:Kinetochore protein Nuf2 N-terminal domain-containing protein n=1 Tax=Rhododendron simsii TaxID=118357 RepID=A0A834GF43_RHOSS|nr:hypothetical protein RHSIM_Rhsim09G0048500 [Rhododendron simsii]
MELRSCALGELGEVLPGIERIKTRIRIVKMSVDGEDLEDYGQVDFNALEQLENPDLHVDSVRTMNLFRMVKEVLAALDCPTKFILRDLIKPDADRTELFLSALLNFCIHREDYRQVDFDALEQLENPDLHVDSVRTMNLFKKIKEVLAALDCPKKFILRDLIKLDADRTELFLSALLNFCIHREKYRQVDFDALEQLENPDLHVDSVRTMHLFRKIKEALAAQDCPTKFILRDLIKPDADRTELFLSALLNFCIHRFQRSCEMIAILTWNFLFGNEFVNAWGGVSSHVDKDKDKAEDKVEDAEDADMDVVVDKEEEKEVTMALSIMTLYQEINFQHQGRVDEEEAAVVEEIIIQTREGENYDFFPYFEEEQSVFEAPQELITPPASPRFEPPSPGESSNERTPNMRSLSDLYEASYMNLSRYMILGVHDLSTTLIRGAKNGHIHNVKSEVEEKRRDLESRETKLQAVVAEADAMSMKSNSVKESGAAKRQELCRKSEEIVSQELEVRKPVNLDMLIQFCAPSFIETAHGAPVIVIINSLPKASPPLSVKCMTNLTDIVTGHPVTNIVAGHPVTVGEVTAKTIDLYHCFAMWGLKFAEFESLDPKRDTGHHRIIWKLKKDGFFMRYGRSTNRWTKEVDWETE